MATARDGSVWVLAIVGIAHASVELPRPPALWLAYESYLRAADVWWSAWSNMQAEDLYKTRRLLERSIAADPSYARSYAMLANTYTNAWVIPWDDDYLKPQTLHRALDLARKAILLDLNLTYHKLTLSLGRC
jgi:hypothetical protein